MIFKSAQMGNTNKKPSVQELLEFIDQETRKWNEIRAKVRGQQPSEDSDSYIYNEFQSTKENWKKIEKVLQSQEYSNSNDERGIVYVYEKDIKRYKDKIQNLKSENVCLQQHNNLLEAESKENKTTLSKLEQCISELNQRRQQEHAASKPASVVDKKATNKQRQLECEQKIKTLQKKLVDRDDEINILKANIDSLRMQNKVAEEEKNDLLLRLSKLAGERLVVNNPAITDLSDPNRPTKLGESYCELYDNEWTNAIEVLQATGYEEERAVETLRLTLMNIYEFCQAKASMVLKKSTDAVNLLFEEYKQSVTVSIPSHLTVRVKNPRQRQSVLQSVFARDIKLQHRWKPKSSHSGPETSDCRQSSTGTELVVHKEKLTEKAENKLIQLRKDVAVSMVPIVQEAYMEASWDPECLDAIRPFIMNCLHISWMMVVQSPPMVFKTCEADDTFYTSMFKDYTKRGSNVDFMVWPALLLEKDGHVVAKGVAQGKAK